MATQQPPHVQRMQVERDELADKVSKLTAFTKGETFAALGELDRALLRIQLGAMAAYLQTLELRLAYI